MTMFMVCMLVIFLQCYPWDRYEWNEPSKNIKQELQVVGGELDLQSVVFNPSAGIVIRFNA